MAAAIYFRLNSCANLLKQCNISTNNVIHARGFKRYVAPTIYTLNNRKKLAPPLPIEKTKRSNYIEWNHNAELYAFGKRLGEDFKIELLLEAFVNRSYVIQEELKQQEVGIENPSVALKDNGRLADLGRQIISNEIMRFLSASLPKLPRECIQSIHDHLVSEERLAAVSKNLGTTDIILTADYPVEATTLVRTLEAVIGAAAESQSEETANKLVVDFIISQLAEKDVNDLFELDDPLTLVTDILARDGFEPPEPRIIGQSAMNEILAAYTVGLYSNKKLIGKGVGETISIAVEMAARDTLRRFFKTTDRTAPIKFNSTYSTAQPSNLPLATWKISAFN